MAYGLWILSRDQKASKTVINWKKLRKVRKDQIKYWIQQKGRQLGWHWLGTSSGRPSQGPRPGRAGNGGWCADDLYSRHACTSSEPAGYGGAAETESEEINWPQRRENKRQGEPGGRLFMSWLIRESALGSKSRKTEITRGLAEMLKTRLLVWVRLWLSSCKSFQGIKHYIGAQFKLIS